MFESTVKEYYDVLIHKQVRADRSRMARVAQTTKRAAIKAGKLSSKKLNHEDNMSDQDMFYPLQTTNGLYQRLKRLLLLR